MRLIDADALRMKAQHAKDVAKWDGELLVVGLGHVINAPTIESPRPDWAPCAEGAPTKSGRYNVTILDKADGQIVTDTDTFFANENQWASSYERIDGREIGGGKNWRVMSEEELRFVNVAWQPLPEPYNPDRKEDADHIVDANKKAKEDEK